MTFTKRINSAMSMFTKTRAKLMAINIEMNNKVNSNYEKIETLESENEELTTMYDQNTRVIGNINSIIDE